MNSYSFNLIVTVKAFLEKSVQVFGRIDEARLKFKKKTQRPVEPKKRVVGVQPPLNTSVFLLKKNEKTIVYPAFVLELSVL